MRQAEQVTSPILAFSVNLANFHSSNISPIGDSYLIEQTQTLAKSYLWPFSKYLCHPFLTDDWSQTGERIPPLAFLPSNENNLKSKFLYFNLMSFLLEILCQLSPPALTIATPWRCPFQLPSHHRDTEKARPHLVRLCPSRYSSRII
jgi:hypothetical protein